MPFTTSIAGPSRLPFQALSRTRHLLLSQQARRRYATEEAASEPTDSIVPAEESVEASLAYPDSSPVSADDGVAATPAAAAKLTKEVFYRDWLRSEGEHFRSPVKGQKAKWLGESTPYPSNPSFRPPPPLSNYLQEQLYSELKRGRKIGELAEKYNVSKARIEAVRKLKEVEAEFKRRQAFLDAMEPLLGVQVPINPNTKQHDAARARQIDMTYDSHPSTSTERLEEQRWESGVGQEGSFGDRSRVSAKPGIERTAWEYRDEEKALQDRKVLKAKEEEVKRGPSHHGVAAEVLHREILSASLFPTPSTEQDVEKKRVEEERAKRPQTAAQIQGITVGGIHFVDTSSKKAFSGEHRGENIREKRHRRVEKKQSSRK